MFQLSGLVVGGIGIWTVIAKHSYISLMATSTYPILAYALIAAGSLAVIGSWLGCGGVSSENRCVLLVSKFLCYFKPYYWDLVRFFRSKEGCLEIFL
ncbi:hypothetical protein PV326_007269 [Microctonus aethiopoides]|nr:hypothetical protein PV326_007269 [Microctonus aethiopoides]